MKESDLNCPINLEQECRKIEKEIRIQELLAEEASPRFFVLTETVKELEELKDK